MFLFLHHPWISEVKTTGSSNESGEKVITMGSKPSSNMVPKADNPKKTTLSAKLITIFRVMISSSMPTEELIHVLN